MNKYYGQNFGDVYAWAADAEIGMKFRRGNQLAIIISDPSANVHVSIALNDKQPFCANLLLPALLAVRGTPACHHCNGPVELLCDGWRCMKCYQRGHNAYPVRTLENPKLTAEQQNRPYVRWPE